MKKFKKVFAVLLTLAMVLGMSVTSFAAEATITVNNADKATLHYLQIIKADPTKKTGWAFVNGADTYFKQAYGTDKDDQTIIQAIIDAGTATESYKKALSYVNANLTFEDMENPQTVEEAGVYAIKATEENYTYNNMAAFVGFGNVQSGDYPTLTGDTLDAKKASTVTSKTDKDKDGVTEVGKTVGYEITTNFPYVPTDATNKSYYIYDKLTGATYKEDTFKVELGTDDITNDVEVVFTDDQKGFSINLSDYINDANTNAGLAVKVSYSALVTSKVVDNKALGGDSSHANDDGSNWTTVTTYTGEVTIKKFAEDGTTPLSGAKFVVYKTVNGAPKYATFTTENNENILSGWVDTVDAATKLTTGSDGTATLKGVDVDTTYSFKEVEAPEGYSLNDVDVTATFTPSTDRVTEAPKAEQSMSDTKLSSLPSTGGIGTTIFTIGGCAIMIIAAALFFASRRKAAK